MNKKRMIRSILVTSVLSVDKEPELKYRLQILQKKNLVLMNNIKKKISTDSFKEGESNEFIKNF